MSFGIALSLIGILISMEESGGGLIARFKWKWDLFFWAWKCVKNTSEVLYKKCMADFIQEIVRNYESCIFSEDDMEKICNEFINTYPKACLSKLQLKGLLEEFNEKRKVHFTPGEEAIRTEMKKGLDDVKKAVSASKEEIMNVYTSEEVEAYWNAIVQRLKNSSISLLDFREFIIGKCSGLLERTIMLVPNIVSEKDAKYQSFFNQCCVESKLVDPYKIVVNALSENFEGCIVRYWDNKPYYSSVFVKFLQKSPIKCKKITDNDVLVDKFFEKLKSVFGSWDEENVLSEYVEYFLDVLTDEQIVKLAEPYAEIFIDDYRQECSPYGTKEPFKNKVIAKKIVEKNRLIIAGKEGAVYPALKHFFSRRKWSDETDSEFRDRMWRNYSSKLADLGVDKNEFMQIPM